jgi:flagellar protein FlbD
MDRVSDNPAEVMTPFAVTVLDYEDRRFGGCDPVHGLIPLQLFGREKHVREVALCKFSKASRSSLTRRVELITAAADKESLSCMASFSQHGIARTRWTRLLSSVERSDSNPSFSRAMASASAAVWRFFAISVGETERPESTLQTVPAQISSLPADMQFRSVMIQLTRINRTLLVLNSDLIEHVEVTPDTVISMTTGQKFMVRESAEEVIQKVVAFRRQVCEGLSGCPVLTSADACRAPRAPGEWMEERDAEGSEA